LPIKRAGKSDAITWRTARFETSGYVLHHAFTFRTMI
jgi:hypothetical protein